MTDLQVAGLVALALAGAVLAVLRARRAPVATVAELRTLLAGADFESVHRRHGQQLVAVVARHWSGRLGDDLELLLASSPRELAGRLLATSAIAAFGALVGLAAALGTGVLAPSPTWFVVVPTAGGIGAVVTIRSVTASLQRRRRELSHAVADLLQLLVIGLSTDQSVDEALGYALNVGAGPGFELVRARLSAAPARGLAMWDALDELGRRTGVDVLCELASSVEQQGRGGVSIRETVGSMAAAARSTLLDELERDGERANANLAGPTTAFVLATVAFLAYPLAVRIGQAFGG